MAHLIRYRPQRSLVNSVDRIWDRMFDGFPSVDSWFERARSVPSVDVRESDEAYVLEAELPGLTEKDIEVNVENRRLTLASSTKEEKEKEEKSDGYVVHERRSREFSRTFALPENVDEQKISASFKNGLLELTIPKGEQAKPKRIEVSVN